MKIIFTFLAAFLVSLSFSQQIPNGDFENWTKILTYENPDDWDTPNPETSMASTYGVVKENTDVVSGNHAIKLTTVQIPFVNLTVPGFATLAEFSINQLTQNYEIIGGEPFTSRPNILVGYYKYAPKNGDAFVIGVLLTKYNSDLNKIDTVGGAVFESGTAVTTWTYFELPINYQSAQNPDTLNIVLISSNDENNMQLGSTLMVDSLAFEYCNLAYDNIGVQDCSYQGATDGQLTITASGGSGVFDYSLNQGLTWQQSHVFSGLTAGKYVVYTRDQNKHICEIRSDSVEVKDGPNAIGENPFKSVEIYPNPVQDVLILNGLGNTSSEIKLYSIHGKIIFHKRLTAGETEVDLAKVQAGIYFLQLTIRGYSFTKKIMISH